MSAVSAAAPPPPVPATTVSVANGDAKSRLRQDSLNSLGSTSSSSSSSAGGGGGAILLSVANLDGKKSAKNSSTDLERDADTKVGQMAADVDGDTDVPDDAGASRVRGVPERVPTTKYPNAKRSLKMESEQGGQVSPRSTNQESASANNNREIRQTSKNNSANQESTQTSSNSTSANQESLTSNNSSSSLSSPRCQHTPSGEICEEVAKLHSALACMQEKLHAKDTEISKLSRIRDDVEAELEDLTASLFEEAHKMVRDANVKQASAEKLLVEANMKIEGLETEVSALKTLVLTSTPSQPNKHLHPQLMPEKGKKKKSLLDQSGNKNGSSESVASNNSLLFNGSSPVVAPSACHRRLNSDSEYRRLSPNSSASSSPNPSLGAHSVSASEEDQGPLKSMDPTLRKDFLHWRKHPTLSREESPFVDRLFREDLDPCLTFPNGELSRKVSGAIGENALCLTPVKDFSKVPRDCALMQAPVLCRYILKVLHPQNEENKDEEDEEYFVSQLGRNRLTSVCDLLSYMRYVQQGLVKAHVNDVYWEIMRLRRNVVMARLGFGLPEHD